MTAKRERPFSPAQVAHRGSVEAVGFVLDERLAGEQARARILALWRPGASLRRLDRQRWWLRLDSAVRVRVEAAPGVPLVNEGGIACGAPGLGAVARQEGGVDGAAALLVGGFLELLTPQTGEPFDPSSWLDLAGFEVVSVSGPAVAPAAVGASLPPALGSIREVLGAKIPAATPEAQKISAELARMAAGAGPRPGTAPGPAVPSAAIQWLAGLFQTLSAVLTRLMVSRGSSSLGRAASAAAASVDRAPSRGLVVRPVEPSGPGVFERAVARLNDLAARLLMSSRLAPLLGRKQAEYLGRMMEMFEQGDLDEALRHAIPLGGEGGGGASFTLGSLAPRSGLSISAGGGGLSSSVLPFAGLHDELKRLYRAAFERLDAQGNIEQAAFVLAELLRETEEAVAYLERHDKLQLAAELAEGRSLPAGLVVRQWFLAGNLKRALLLARRHKAFADAVLYLEQRGAPDRAMALRTLWADTQANAGDFLGAEQILRELPEAHELRLGWLDQAIAQGGSRAAEAWVRKLRLAPEHFEAAVRALQPLLDDTAPEAHRDRLALAGAITAQDQENQALRALARPLLRVLLRDLGPDTPEPAALTRLRESFADAVMRLDWPPYRGAPAAEPGPDHVEKIHIHEASAGTMAIRDAVVLPGGRFLVALGEAGVLLVSREGKTQHLFEQPATSLVLSTRGDRALALAPRGRVTRVARLDLTGRRSQVWCEAELSSWLHDFDGSSWVVGSRGALLEIDALSEGWTSLWQVRDVGGAVVGCWAGQDSTGPLLGVAVEAPTTELHLWQFDGASRALRRRDGVFPAIKPDQPAPLLAGHHDGLIRWDADGRLDLLKPAASPQKLAVASFAPLPPAGALAARPPGGAAPDRPRSLRVLHGQLLCAQGDRALGWKAGEARALPRLEAHLAGASQLVTHPSPFGLALADDRGRLLRVEGLVGGPIEVVRNVRI